MELDRESMRVTESGVLIGLRESSGIYAWRGVPFARPPVGSLRWRAPQPPLPWQGVLEARRHGAMPPQFGDVAAGVRRAHRGRIVGDEDCLTLNIFAPAMPAEVARERRLPVMVWIFGGAMAVGTAGIYDAARNYSIHDDIVVVTVNYRLGVLGWFHHPALHDETSTADDRSGNFGTLDVVAALRWVQRNIAAFGGDANCVTIFGESAGALQVLNLLVSPRAAGLFHRAIAQSPAVVGSSPARATHWRDDVEPGDPNSAFEVTARLLVAAGEARDHAHAKQYMASMSLACQAEFLRGRSAEQLLNVFTPGSLGIYLGPRPIHDGVVLPQASMIDALRSGRWNRVPVILGSNRDEYKTFMAKMPEHSRLIAGEIPLLRNRSEYLKEAEYLSRAWQIQGVDEIAEAMEAGGHRDVWTYRFEWDEYPKVPFIRPDLVLGANHVLEIAFAFRDTSGEMDVFHCNTRRNRAGRRFVATAMGDCWTSFARTGEPRIAGSDGPVWQRSTGRDELDSMLFDSPANGGVRMARTRTSFAALKSRLYEDRDLGGRLRCQIYARMFLWSPLIKGRGSLAEYEHWAARFGCCDSADRFRPVSEI
ncbi:carboxylesterase [Burkholderia lata]|nr:carboxylesterase [Burkholderia lata]